MSFIFKSISKINSVKQAVALRHEELIFFKSAHSVKIIRKQA